MYIKSIKLKNFQCFYESHIDLNFGKGLNLIYGENNKGKSKLFDAFYWVLFGEIYVSSAEKWIDTDLFEIEKINKCEFVNRKALSLSNKNDIVKCFVELVINYSLNNHDTDIKIKRYVNALRKDNELDWTKPGAWDVGRNKIEISYRENTDFKIIDNKAEVELFIEKLFPSHLRKYIWFQGEALNKLIDFKNTGPFRDAIKHISYYPIYQTLDSLSSEVVKIITKEKNAKIKLHTSKAKEYDEILKSIEEKTEELADKKKELDIYEADLIKTNEAIEKTTQELEALHEYPPLEKQKTEAESKMDIAKFSIEHAQDEQKRKFQTLWMLKGVSELLDISKERILKYSAQLNEDSKYKNIDQPGPAYLDDIIDKKHCYICDTTLDNDKVEYVRGRKNAYEEYYLRRAESENLKHTINSVRTMPDNLRIQVGKIDDEIRESERAIDTFIKQRNQANTDFYKAQSDIDSLMAKYNISLSTGVKQAKEKQAKISMLNSLFFEYNAKIDNRRSTIKQIQDDIKEFNEKLNQIIKPDEINNIPEMGWYEIVTILQSYVENVKTEARVQLIKRIESAANNLYQEISKHTNSPIGEIHIDIDTYKISRIQKTEDGISYIIESGNDGHDVLMKMCIINAILTLTQKATKIFYPFIVDAPTSKLDDLHTSSYLKAISEAYEQSIVFTKDLPKQFQDEMENNDNVVKIYSLYTDVTDSESEGISAEHKVFSNITPVK